MIMMIMTGDRYEAATLMSDVGCKKEDVYRSLTISNIYYL